MSIASVSTACTGCSACAAVCPRQCIRMLPDAEGFCRPQIDGDACVKCGLCEKTCPILHQPSPADDGVAAFACFAADEPLRLKSSSGGIFSLLAEAVLKDGGLVCGAAFDAQHNVRHLLIETPDGLSRLRGSKYAQSDLDGIFPAIREALDAGRTVLFSGVACQVAGLKNFLGKSYENLVTVDVLCHGVPSPQVWRRYLDESEAAHGAAAREVAFRDKRQGWKRYTVAVAFDNGDEYHRVFRDDPYMQLFLSDICLRPSCHDCRFKGLDRPSDITLGDCWGIGGTMPAMDDDKGTSVVLVRGEKGRRLFEAIRPQITVCEAAADTLLPPTAGGRRSAAPHPKRALFFRRFADGATVGELAQMVKAPLWKRCAKKALSLLKGKR